jgi:hypothetical protein
MSFFKALYLSLFLSLSHTLSHYFASFSFHYLSSLSYSISLSTLSLSLSLSSLTFISFPPFLSQLLVFISPLPSSSLFLNPFLLFSPLFHFIFLILSILSFLPEILTIFYWKVSHCAWHDMMFFLLIVIFKMHCSSGSQKNLALGKGGEGMGH